MKAILKLPNWLTILGVIAGLALAAYSAMSGIKKTYSVSASTLAPLTPAIFSSNTRLDMGPTVLTLEPEVKLPDTIRIGEAFAVRVVFRIAETRTLHDDAPLPEEFTEGVLLELAQRLVLELRLSVDDVLPKDPQRIGDDLTAVWSVRAENEGTHDGFIVAHVLTNRRQEDMRYLDEVHANFSVLASPLPISITVTSAGVKIGGILSISGLIIGLIVAVTNLIVFYWKWSDRREKGKPKKPTIIMPQ